MIWTQSSNVLPVWLESRYTNVFSIKSPGTEGDKVVINRDEKKPVKRGVIVIGLTVVALLLVSCAGVPAVKKTETLPMPTIVERIKVDGIDHFARIDTGVYRGATPTPGGLRALAREHVKTLICLRSEVPNRQTAQELGFRIEHIPLSPFNPPSSEQIRRFLEVATDPSAKPVFFYCWYGKDRTGVMAAVYRMHVQGWSEEAAMAEMMEFEFSRKFFDLRKFVSSYREFRLKTSEEPKYTKARLKHAKILSKSGEISLALSEARQAMIRTGSIEERIRVARVTIEILAEAIVQGKLPPYGFDIAEREWTLLEINGAEDHESLLRLGELFQRGLHLSQALEAFERARIKAKFPEKELDARVARIRAVHSQAPRSDLGKKLGLMPQVNRGEVAALLIQELRVDRLRALQGSPTWRPTLEESGIAPTVKDIAESPYRVDIKHVLALGIRGLEPFADQTFRPNDPVSRAEFVVILEDVLTRATGDQTLPTQLLGKSSPFSDVKEGVWFQSAADLARNLGLFASPPGETPEFRPLDPITGLETLEAFRLIKKRLDIRTRVIVVVVDALRAESAYGPLDEGELFNLNRLVRNRGVIRFEKCLSALPSITLPNHTTIFTGVYPGRHGVPGNEWFDRTLDNSEPLYRRTREYVKYGSEDDPGLGRAWSFGGIPVHDMDLSSDVRTIYEGFEAAEAKRGREARTAVVFDPVRRGADKVINPDIFDALISLNFLPFVDQFAALDASAMRKAIELIKSEDPPELMGIWLSGLDGWSHANGPGPVGGAEDRQAGYVKKNIDPLMGMLIDTLEDRGLLNETVIVFTSDHGQADTIGKEEYAIDAEKLYQALAGTTYRTPLDKDGHLDDHATDFDVAVMSNSNGNAALISIRTPGADWNAPPTRADLDAVASIILNEPYVSRIFFPGPQASGNEPGIFKLTRGDDGPIVVQLCGESEELLLVRALGLAGSSRSGDLLVEAHSPYYFAPSGSIYYGQHGRGERAEDHVPLLILNPSGGRQHMVRSVVEIADISPTVAGVLGFLDFLDADGKDLLDPPKIIVSSHTEDQPVPAGRAFSILGFAKDAVGIQRVEFRFDDEEKFRAASGSSFWEARVKLPRGRHAITVRATDETGIQSTVRFHLVAH